MNKKKYILSISIVLYNNTIEMIDNLFESINKISITHIIYLIDNSNTDLLSSFKYFNNVVYIKSNKNLGFGPGHNLAIDAINNKSYYHLILNPDISFENGVIENLISTFEKNLDFGIIMPKILYPNNTLQTCAKLLPRPIDLILRRINPNSKILHNYELKSYDYNKIVEAPFLSGCFMLCRTSTLTDLNGFDPNIFLYMEDVDLCRRFNLSGFKTIIYPFEYVKHDHVYKSLLSSSTFKYFIKSALYYFNKWGWFIDYERNKINKKALRQF